MRILCTLGLLLQLLDLSSAASACKKDGCYNHVAVNAPNSPKLASRLADCKSILRTVVDDDVTATSTLSVSTSITETVSTTTTGTVVVTKTILVPPQFKRGVVVDNMFGEPSLLEARDQIVINGNKPGYATSCKSNKDFAIACLCYGVKAAVQKTATQINTSRQTVTSTLSATSIRTTTTSTTTELTRPSSCSIAQSSDCSSCICGIGAQDNTRYCFSDYRCKADATFQDQTCQVNEDCVQYFPGAPATAVCVFDTFELCGFFDQTVTICGTTTDCAAPQPFKRGAKREIEEVFEGSVQAFVKQTKWKKHLQKANRS